MRAVSPYIIKPSVKKASEYPKTWGTIKVTGPRSPFNIRNETVKLNPYR